MLKGSQIAQSKLTEKKVRMIKGLLNSGTKNQRQIAIKFGVHYVTINDIKYGRSWSHVV